MKHTSIFLLSLLLFSSCKKPHSTDFTNPEPPVPVFIQYTIQPGNQYCDQSIFKIVNYSELRFVARFDSSAIYANIDPLNQLDINKLFGFSDNNSDHQQFSARFGWRWSENLLHIFGYTYNNGVRNSKELGTISIGIENDFSIKVNPTNYTFSLNGVSDTMLRTSTTPVAMGYKLYPYFGGDEPAPHQINIWIKELY